ncbi:hypothetical protein FHS19_004896 [Paenibacillus rhizosphaerae]|uniref:Uncharacterized protein n=1 Tax=Paenibacillus rhizosphaerae TaxID=297318 RepID=A0A839TUH8_9BACL|nr:hypothetical protein [Paenibacillus rhizosphaerae]MBB3130191.1 hypothetical protein [Paenibacillus rhizosphaerae]
MHSQLAIKYPLRAKFLLCMVTLLVITVPQMFNSPDDSLERGTFVFRILLLLFIAGAIAVSLYRSAGKPKTLLLEPEKLVLEGKEVSTADIHGVWINERWYGIKLKQRRIVPMKLCFVLQPRQPAGEPELLQWAEEHGIPVERRFFIRWM